MLRYRGLQDDEEEDLQKITAAKMVHKINTKMTAKHEHCSNDGTQKCRFKEACLPMQVPYHLSQVGAEFVR